MDTIQIQHALQDVNSFLGAYASDLLPLSIVQVVTGYLVSLLGFRLKGILSGCHHALPTP